MRASIFFVVGIAAAVLAGCGGLGSSATASTSSARTSPSPARANFNGAAGQLTKLSGGKMTVSDQAGAVTVSYDTSTTVLQSGTGSLADIVAGACVTANGQREANGAVTAAGVQVMLNMNGNCTQPAGGFGAGAGNGTGNGQGPGGQSPRPGRGSPSPGASPPANVAFVRGKVSAVNGATVTVEQDTGGPVTVTVPSTARITRTVSSTTARLAVGECVTATGQRDSSGTVKARAIVISAPGPNGCAIGAGRGFGPGGGRPSASPRSA
ncbi:MAG TPA: DUF5666 domain-containing protein [Candidatus Dormibacteraeota bacterium]